MKTSKNVVKSGWKALSFFEIKEDCKVSCLKLAGRSKVAQKGTNILIFYIFEYGAEWKAESGAK